MKIGYAAVYDETIAYAKLSESDKGNASEREEAEVEEGEENPPPPPIKVGDFVQWTSNGIDQFKPHRKVEEILPDGFHARIFGSQTGIPMSELTVVDPPKRYVQEPVVAGTNRADNTETKSDVSVLMRGNRLEIMANVDAKGLETLREMLEKYGEILKLMN